MNLRELVYLLIACILIHASFALSDEGPPSYLPAASCNLKYTVTKEGGVRDIQIVSCTTEDTEIKEQILKIASGYQYEPRTRDGVAVEVPNVEITVNYYIEPDTEN